MWILTLNLVMNSMRIYICNEANLSACASAVKQFKSDYRNTKEKLEAVLKMWQELMVGIYPNLIDFFTSLFDPWSQFHEFQYHAPFSGIHLRVYKRKMS